MSMDTLPDRTEPPTPAGMASADSHMFTFGEPEGVLDQRELTEYFEIWHNGKWYEPPLPMSRLGKAFNMSPHHRSAVALKVNLLVAHLRESRWLNADDFERFALDFIQMGNAYLENIPNLGGRIARAGHAPAAHMRRGMDDGVFWFVKGGLGTAHEYRAGHVFHLMQPDVAQEIYGLPEWLSALQSGLLNESATLFRRRYYRNGAHAGFVFYVSDALGDRETVEAMAKKLEDAKGVGNFKNLFVNIPGGKKDGIQIMPIADVAAKDEFAAIKNISRDDLLTAHRVPPQLIGIIPLNNGGFGKVGEARDAFYATEMVPLMRRMLRMNDWFGVRLLQFDNYTCSDGSQITQEGKHVPAERVV